MIIKNYLKIKVVFLFLSIIFVGQKMRRGIAGLGMRPTIPKKGGVLLNDWVAVLYFPVGEFFRGVSVDAVGVVRGVVGEYFVVRNPKTVQGHVVCCLGDCGIR